MFPSLCLTAGDYDSRHFFCSSLMFVADVTLRVEVVLSNRCCENNPDTRIHAGFRERLEAPCVCAEMPVICESGGSSSGSVRAWRALSAATLSSEGLSRFILFRIPHSPAREQQQV